MTEGVMVDESESDLVDESESEAVDERREYRRVEVDFSVQVQAPVRGEAEALELSEGGLRIEIGEDFSQAMHVSLRFELPDRSAPIATLADIRWHEQVGSKAEPRWRYGLRFSDLDPDQEADIIAHVDRAQADDN